MYLAIALSILALMTMFRAGTIGNDTLNYIQTFTIVSRENDIAAYIRSSAIEPGYLLWNWLISRVTNNPQALFVMSGLVFYVSLSRFVYKWVPAPGLLVYALVTMHLFDGYLSTMRQTLALTILLFAFDMAYEKKPFSFAILCLTAMQFHMAALLFFIVYPVVNVDIAPNDKGTKALVYILLVALLGIITLAFDNVLSLLIRVFPKYRYYLGGSRVNGETRIATVLNIVVYGLMLSIPRFFSLDSHDAMEEKNSTAFERLAVLNIIVLVISMNATIITRFTGLFTLFSVGDYSHMTANLTRRDHVILVLLSILLLYFYGLVIAILRTPEWYTTYPFAFCWM